MFTATYTITQEPDQYTPILAVSIVYGRLKAHFEAEIPGVPVLFGWREPPKTINRNPGNDTRVAMRICVIPGDGADMVGVDRSAKYPGRNPASIATLTEAFRVRLWAVNMLQTSDELAQYEAARMLYDAVRRALFLADPGGLAISQVRWIRENKERIYGAEIEIVCTVDANIPDTPYAELPPGTGEGEAGIYMDDTYVGQIRTEEE